MRRPRFVLNTILGVVISAGACSSGHLIVDEPSAPAYSLTSLVSGVLLHCSALPYSSTSATIGSGGGTLVMGPHRLVIPAGALAADTRITGEVLSDNVNSVRFTPEGLQFQKSATLTLSYRNCSGAGLLPVKRVAFTTESLGILEQLQSLDQPGDSQVSGALKHFSRYAVAY
jgi:hypothetical protein